MSKFKIIFSSLLVLSTLTFIITDNKYKLLKLELDRLMIKSIIKCADELGKLDAVVQYKCNVSKLIGESKIFAENNAIVVIGDSRNGNSYIYHKNTKILDVLQSKKDTIYNKSIINSWKEKFKLNNIILDSN